MRRLVASSLFAASLTSVGCSRAARVVDAVDAGSSGGEGEGEGDGESAGEGEGESAGEGEGESAGEGEGESAGEGEGESAGEGEGEGEGDVDTVPSGWLFTQGNRIYLSGGAAGAWPWMGRGVNLSDIFHCGGNGALIDPAPSSTMQTLIEHVMSEWRPNFVRVSLAMNTYPGMQMSWRDDHVDDPARYKDPMIQTVRMLGQHPGVFVLVTLRSDASMLRLDNQTSIPDATFVPSDASTTPDPLRFPDGTDDVYRAIVQTFAHDSFVLFGISNEPGADTLPIATIRAAMSHAVSVIRAEEDRLGVPHHLVSVQGRNWTKDVSDYAAHPLPYDDVVYEVHGYPPLPSMYTHDTIPVIVGEYGGLGTIASRILFADLENKQIPSLAWVLEPFVDCTPDLVRVTHDPAVLTPSDSGALVQRYLLDHAP